MKLFCKHKWSKIGERIVRMDTSSAFAGYYNYQDITVVLLYCKECGKIKKVKMK